MNLSHPNGYQIACDCCGKTLDWGGRTVFKSVAAAVETAKTLGWKAIKSAAYHDCCPNCKTALEKC